LQSTSIAYMRGCTESRFLFLLGWGVAEVKMLARWSSSSKKKLVQLFFLSLLTVRRGINVCLSDMSHRKSEKVESAEKKEALAT